jgi:two-component system, sensor histidine kinase and response regulator
MNAISRITEWKVLVVDDEMDSIEVVTEVLEFYGATVYNASNGVQALDVLQTVTPDVILSDLSMPQMDGWALLSNLRKNERLASIPVIALTAHAMQGDAQRGISAGFTAYLTKPVSVISLIQDLIERVPSLA